MEDLSKKEILGFWDSLMGEKSREDIYDMIEYVYGKTVDNLADDYNKYNSRHEQNVSKLIRTYNAAKNDKSIIYINEEKWSSISNVIINNYWKEITKIYKYEKMLLDTEQVINVLINKIAGTIFFIIYKSVILDIKYYKHNNLLKGNTPEERAEYFSNVIVNSDEYLYDFFEGYPEAVSVMENITRFSIDAIIELLDNTYIELDNINEVFFKNDNVRCIYNISMDKGDTHNEGRTVAIIEFDNGKKLVYKPRKLEIEDAYNKYIEWLDNSLNDNKGLIIPKVYYNDKVGWMEFVEHNSCNNDQDIEDYYYKVGKLMAVLYTFNSNDMHSGNIIAVGNSPVLIDLETILHPNYEMKEIKTPLDVAIKEYSGSVERSSLLPSYIVNPRTKKKIDVGGLSNSEEQESPFECDTIVNFDSDEIKILKKKGIMETENNIPIMNGNKITVENYLSNIEEGFKNTYMWIENNKQDYINKVYSLFANIPNRVLLRGTNEYSKILNLSYHPDLLVNRLDRSMYLIRALSGTRINNKDVVKCEFEQLLKTDIPYFYSFSDSKDLYYNNQVISKDYYSESSLDIVCNKVNNMSEIDMNRQISMMYNKFNIEYPYKSRKARIKEQKNNYINSMIDTLINLIDKKSIRCKNVSGATWFSKNKDTYDCSITSNLNGEFYKGITGVFYVLYNYDNNRFNKDINTVIEDYIKVCNKEKIDYDVIKEAIILYNMELLSLDKIEGYNDIISNYIEKLKENKDYIELNSLYGILITAYNKMIGVDESNVNKIVEFIKDITLYLINYMKKVEKNIAGYKFIDGYYSILYQLVRYSIIFNDKINEINELVEDYLNYERTNKIYDLKKDFNKYDYEFVQMMYGKALLYKNMSNNEKLYEEIVLGIDIIKDICIEHKYKLFGGDAGNIVMLYYVNNIINNEKLSNVIKNYINTFINEFVIKELEKGGHFDVYESFSLDNGVTGIVYALMLVSEQYKMINVFTME